MKSPFYKSEDEYVRDVNPLKHYTEDAVTYLMANTGQSKEVCQEFVMRSLKTGGVFGAGCDR
jgi:predicted ThiF/HesA family dinucleotide-utilizing enzyme